MDKRLIVGIFILLMIGIFVTAKTIDTSMDFDKVKKDILKEIGIENPTINPCIKIDEYTCRANIYEKGGINKDIKVITKYCLEYEINATTNETTTNCLNYKTLTQLEIENELKNQTENLLNQIADIQISRNKTKEILTDGILIEIKEKAKEIK